MRYMYTCIYASRLSLVSTEIILHVLCILKSSTVICSTVSYESPCMHTCIRICITYVSTRFFLLCMDCTQPSHAHQLLQFFPRVSLQYFVLRRFFIVPLWPVLWLVFQAHSPLDEIHPDEIVVTAVLFSLWIFSYVPLPQFLSTCRLYFLSLYYFCIHLSAVAFLFHVFFIFPARFPVSLVVLPLIRPFSLVSSSLSISNIFYRCNHSFDFYDSLHPFQSLREKKTRRNARHFP